MKVLLTGAAGFIGMSVGLRLLERGDEVLGIDNLNTYYGVKLKQDRLNRLVSQRLFQFERLDITDYEGVSKLFARRSFDRVVHLAAQAGVRCSLKNPRAYIDSNIVGFLNVLEACRQSRVDHLVYASSSSVYGGNTKMPFSESDNVDHPLSLYAATKKANELMAHTYSHLYGLPTTGLRFFTVYGPWDRPDMAMFLFTKAIAEGRPIDVFNGGRMLRDFTYVDDIVKGVVKTMDTVATSCATYTSERPDPATSSAPYRVFNIGCHQPVTLLDFIACIESALGKKADKRLMPLQNGDVLATDADVSALRNWVNFAPSTTLDVGVKKYVDWYRTYYGVP